MLSLAALAVLLLPAQAQLVDWSAGAGPLFGTALAPLAAPKAFEAPTETEFPETVSRPPRSDVNPKEEGAPRECVDRPAGYSACNDLGKTDIESFFFYNEGGNAVVRGRFDPLKGFPSRWFHFFFASQARQDLYFSISDTASDRISQNLESYFMIFPRKVLPSIRVRGDRYVVTLPDEETVLFDAKTKEMRGGVFSETGELKLGVYPRLAYSGKGVLVRVNRMGADPRMRTTAAITKGSASCQVPASELWAGGDVLHFKYPTDGAFDRFLRSRCGFGL